jgi:DHA1 family multidrug resistance protein-like MFS transporter
MEQRLRKYIFSPSVVSLLLTISLNEFVRSALLLTVLPLYLTKHLGLSKTIMGTALAIHYLVDNLLRSPAGWLIDRIGPKLPLMTGVSLEIFALSILTHTHSVLLVFAGCGLLGLGATVIWPAVITGVTNRIERDRTTVIGIIFQFWMVGSGLGPILINLITDATDRFAFLILFWGLGLTLIIVLTLKNAQVTNLKKPKLSKQQYLFSFAKQIKSIRSLFPGMFAQTFAVGLLIPILTLYSNNVLGLSNWWYSVLLASGGTVTILLMIPIGRLVDRFGGRYFLVGGFFLSTLLFVLLPFMRTLLSLFVIVCLIGLAYALILPTWNGLLDRCIPPDKRGAMWGVFMTVEGIGSATGPIVGGTLYDLAGPTAPFWTSALVFAIMTLVYLRHPMTRNWVKRT